MQKALLTALLCGWLVPLLITVGLYYGVMHYERNDSRGWGGFGFFVIAPYFFSVICVLNLWIVALRGRNKRTLFSFGLVLPLAAFVLLLVL
jgi:hypothetical protein